MQLSLVKIIIFLVIVELVLTDPDPNTERKKNERKRKKKGQSTSSSESKAGDSSDTGDSLDFSSSDSSSSSSSKSKSDKKKAYKHRPRSSEERTGWRKWHRKCHPCPEEMRKKWRDPSIRWVCGAYQRARRSFKSDCMMRYRNCQDGTMFVKIHGGRCKNDTETAVRKHGQTFFYDYKAALSDDSTSSEASSSSSSSDEAWKKNWHLD